VTTTEAYIKDKGKEGQAPRQIYKGKRRQAVAALKHQGLSHRKIAKRLNISKSTVARDLKWIASSEHMLRAQEAAKEIVPVEGEDFSVAAFRDHERQQVIDLVYNKHTYEEVAKKLGISIATVIRHVNAFLSEYGDFGGRTMLEWKNEQLLGLYDIMNNALESMEVQPTWDSEGNPELTRYQAEKIRSDARRDFMAAQEKQAKLLQLLVHKTEVDVEQKVIVMNLRGVDTSSFPKQDDPMIIDA